MKLNFRKIASALASAVMLSSTVGFAAAASWPAPFVEDGVADAAIVYPSASAAAATDQSSATKIQSALDANVDSDDDTVYSGEGWMVEDGNDDLEIGEPIFRIESELGEDELEILASSSVYNEKGTADYDQELHFTDNVTQAVVFAENDDEEVGLFFKINQNAHLAQYIVDFTSPNLKSDIESDGDLQDIVDKEISMLGEVYTVTRAVNGSSGVELDLMSGADKTTLSNGEQVVVDGKTVSVLVSSASEAKFTVDGEDSSKLSSGETYKFQNGAYVGVTDITYQEYAGGLAQVTFFMGGSKLELKNGEEVTADSTDIDGTLVAITSTESNADITITEISINMTYEDEDLYIPVGGKLSDQLEEPELIFGENWDIIFSGLGEMEYETLEVDPSSNNEEYVLKVELPGVDDVANLPLFFSNGTTYVKAGEEDGKELIDAPGTSIARHGYIVVANEDPAVASNSDVKSCLVQYKSGDWDDDAEEELIFNVLGEGEVTANYDAEGGESAEVELCGGDYEFTNVSVLAGDNFAIKLTTANPGTVVTGNRTSWLIRTKNNALVNITDGDTTDETAALTIAVSSNDGDLDDDDVDMSTTAETAFSVSVTALAGELVADVQDDTGWQDNPDDDDQRIYITRYGVDITDTDTSDSIAHIEAMIPEEIVIPEVTITEGAVTVGGSSGSSIPMVTDAEVASVSSKNLIVVAGSCINTAAAKLLGSDDPVCTEAFTAKTTVGAGGYIIEVFDSPWDAEGEDKIAMLVAGYNAADTIAAANDVADGISEDIMVGAQILSGVVG